MKNNCPESMPEVLNQKPAKPKTRIVDFLDGPAEGKTRELYDDWPAPDDLGVRDDTDEELMHWYRVFGDKAYFNYSERGGT
jgi:hypothetical protein